MPQMFGRPISGPQIDAFLREYRELCEKHRMKFVVGAEQGHPFVTLGGLSDIEMPDVNLEHASHEVPGMTTVPEILSDAIRAQRTIPS